MIIGQLSGSNGRTAPPFILSDKGFNEGTYEVKVRTDEVGDPTKLKLVKKSIGNPSEPWTFDTITIEHIGVKKTFQGNAKILKTELNLGSKKKKVEVDKAKGVEPPADATFEIVDITKVDIDKAEASFDGGCLSPDDSKDVVNIGCTTDLTGDALMSKLGIGSIDSFGTFRVPN
jgi:hypothetical protein